MFESNFLHYDTYNYSDIPLSHAPLLPVGRRHRGNDGRRIDRPRPRPVVPVVPAGNDARPYHSSGTDNGSGRRGGLKLVPGRSAADATRPWPCPEVVSPALVHLEVGVDAGAGLEHDNHDQDDGDHREDDDPDDQDGGGRGGLRYLVRVVGRGLLGVGLVVVDVVLGVVVLVGQGGLVGDGGGQSRGRGCGRAGGRIPPADPVLRGRGRPVSILREQIIFIYGEKKWRFRDSTTFFFEI